ncbi:MAG: aminotransferase class V-fold PLP-dependent enzyme [Planctomycetota bacterium]|nr:aminotransferase class V-fold PLP-dependent enzyme [Planctomycetota bacterium]
MNVDELRADTPGCAHHAHLNNAGAALMPRQVLEAIRDHLTLEERLGGYEAEEQVREQVAEAYQAVGELTGVPARRVAFTENATASFVQALSSLTLERDDVLLTTRNDYASNQIQLLSLAHRIGVRVIRIPNLPEGGADPQAARELITRHRPRIVCASHVPTNSGLIQDVRSIGRVCREHDVTYLVDACQSVGQLPLDLEDFGADFLSGTARKFLRGPRGSGFLAVSDRVLERGLLPLYPDLHSARWTSENEFEPVSDARRFENWEFPRAIVLGTGAAARYALELGLEAIASRIQELSARLREGLEALEGATVLDHGPELCGIVTTWILDHQPRDLVLALRARGIHAWAQDRFDATLDYDEKGVPGALRLSPHAYNTVEEIDQTLEVLGELGGH